MSWKFGLRRRADMPVPDMTPTTETPAPTAGRVEIEVLTSEGGDRLFVNLGAERLTDLLNRADAGTTWSDSGALDPADILVAFPPARETDPQRRLHRPRQPVRLRIGPYEVTGQVHVPPGAQAAGYLNRANPQFLPITDAVVRRPDTELLERRARVAIVNFRAAALVRDASETDRESPTETVPTDATPPGTDDAPPFAD